MLVTSGPGKVLPELTARINRDKEASQPWATGNTWPVARYLRFLREHRPDLERRYNLASIGIFGSYVRNEQQHGSDLDVLVSLRPLGCSS